MTVLYIDIDGVLNSDAWLRHPEVRAADRAYRLAPNDTAARDAYAVAAIDPALASGVAHAIREAGAEVWVCSSWRRVFGPEVVARALAAHGITIAGCLPYRFTSTRVQDIRAHMRDLPPGTRCVVLDDQVGPQGMPCAVVTPDDGVTADDLAALRAALAGGVG